MRFLASFVVACVFAAQGLAQYNVPSISAEVPDRHAVAIRWWGQGMVSIETYWNLKVVIDPISKKSGSALPDVEADLVLLSHEHTDQNNVDGVKREPHLVRGIDESGKHCHINHRFDRVENSLECQWWEDTKANVDKRTSHTIGVYAIPAWRNNAEGSARVSAAMFKITVDGVTILYCGSLGQAELTDEQLKKIHKVDVLLVSTAAAEDQLHSPATRISQQVKPRFIVPIDYEPKESIGDVMGIDAMWRVEERDHNTLAVCQSQQPVFGSKLVFLSPEPYQPTGELAELLTKMDAACKASQKVFAPLSANQLNWQPPNGTHTPRWNVEHMLGRQLGFFSQIYATIDPDTFAHVDLNPAQMPPDYKAAHPNWDGAEDARQMERANAYVRRFAYLLEGVDLDAKAPGSFWTPRKLLEQMDRHFAEHTANVERKFELEGWPKE
ncbi:MBL fold metallo-hydrolase [Aeoliella mucimassa]|uniref:DinB superfamily protein n=1 Tax=Aeoliella mucimassa TaxID=2527972 RepID=A0A518AUC9_9BACT|nr:MBL fold metallo-hydrolase [Aeoliella mucimassa]QDU58305.1 DinB superfamily protein [Aeoliella mucimassa]